MEKKTRRKTPNVVYDMKRMMAMMLAALLIITMLPGTVLATDTLDEDYVGTCYEDPGTKVGEITSCVLGHVDCDDETCDLKDDDGKSEEDDCESEGCEDTYVDQNMSNSFLTNVLSLFNSLFGDGDDEEQTEQYEFTVRFVVLGETLYTVGVNNGGTLTEPEDPDVDGFTFIGWNAYRFGGLFNFSQPVNFTQHNVLNGYVVFTAIMVAEEEETDHAQLFIIRDPIANTLTIDNDGFPCPCRSNPLCSRNRVQFFFNSIAVDGNHKLEFIVITYACGTIGWWTSGSNQAKIRARDNVVQSGHNMSQGDSIENPTYRRYTIQFTINSNEGTLHGPVSRQVLNGSLWSNLWIPQVVPAPGYVHYGWYNASLGFIGLDGVGFPLTITTNYTFQARLTKNPMLTYHANNGTSESIIDVTREEGTTFALRQNSFINEGYRFLGWSLDRNAIIPQWADGADFTITTSVDLFAVWERDPDQWASVTFQIEGGVWDNGCTLDIFTEVLIGSDWELDIPVGIPHVTNNQRDGIWSWVGNENWTYEDGNWPASIHVDKVFVLTFPINTYTVTFTIANGTWEEDGSTLIEITDVPHGTTWEEFLEEFGIPTPVADAGFTQFDGKWDNNPNERTAPITSNLGFKFSFLDPNQYTVTFIVQNGLWTENNQLNFAYTGITHGMSWDEFLDTRGIPSATPAPGFRADSGTWGGPNPETRVDPITSDLIFVYVFTEKYKFNVTLSVENGNWSEADQARADEDGLIILHYEYGTPWTDILSSFPEGMTPYLNFDQELGWDTELPSEGYITENASFVYKFARSMYTVTFTIVNGTWGEDGSTLIEITDVPHGTTWQEFQESYGIPSASPAEGFRFDSGTWFYNNPELSTAPITSNLDFVFGFTEKYSFSVTFSVENGNWSEADAELADEDGLIILQFDYGTPWTDILSVFPEGMTPYLNYDQELGWDTELPSEGYITQNASFVYKFARSMHTVTFHIVNGTWVENGATTISRDILHGSLFSEVSVPVYIANANFEFYRWTPSLLNPSVAIEGKLSFTAELVFVQPPHQPGTGDDNTTDPGDDNIVDIPPTDGGGDTPGTPGTTDPGTGTPGTTDPGTAAPGTPTTTPGGAALTPEATPEPVDDVEDLDNVEPPLAGDVDIEEEVDGVEEILEEPETPLIGPSGSWALLNLLLTIAIGLTMVMLLITYFIRRKREENTRNRNEMNEDADGQEEQKKLVIRLLSIIPLVGAVILFLLTQDMRQPMVFVDQWTILFALITLAQVTIGFLAKSKKELEAEEQEA